MAVTQIASGSTTPSLATDTQLGSDITTAGIYVLRISAANLADGETLILILKDEPRSGDGVEECERVPAARHAQGTPGIRFGPFEIMHTGQFFLRQENGTARAFKWSIRRLDG